MIMFYVRVVPTLHIELRTTIFGKRELISFAMGIWYDPKNSYHIRESIEPGTYHNTQETLAY